VLQERGQRGHVRGPQRAGGLHLRRGLRGQRLDPRPPRLDHDGEGNAYDLTWRDGGDECGFCFGSGTVEYHRCEECKGDQEECGHDEWEHGYIEVEEDCRFCNGTGKSDYEYGSLDDAAYVGVEVPLDLLRATLMRTGCYGVLVDDEALDALRALTNEQETA
jgi:hypothetical protein